MAIGLPVLDDIVGEDDVEDPGGPIEPGGPIIVGELGIDSFGGCATTG